MMVKFEITDDVRLGFIGRGWFSMFNRYSE
jgi:hypothetical protein